MTTPTKEQIDEVAKELKKFMYIKNEWVLAERAITTWEKLKNSPK